MNIIPPIQQQQMNIIGGSQAVLSKIPQQKSPPMKVVQYPFAGPVSIDANTLSNVMYNNLRNYPNFPLPNGLVPNQFNIQLPPTTHITFKNNENTEKQ